MSIVFGSDEARAVLLKDFRQRNGFISIPSQSDARGGKIKPPAHYVAGDWRDAKEIQGDYIGEEDDFDEGGELGGQWTPHVVGAEEGWS